MALKRSKELENIAAKIYTNVLSAITEDANTITDEEYVFVLSRLLQKISTDLTLFFAEDVE